MQQIACESVRTSPNPTLVVVALETALPKEAACDCADLRDLMRFMCLPGAMPPGISAKLVCFTDLDTKQHIAASAADRQDAQAAGRSAVNPFMRSTINLKQHLVLLQCMCCDGWCASEVKRRLHALLPKPSVTDTTYLLLFWTLSAQKFLQPGSALAVQRG